LQYAVCPIALLTGDIAVADQAVASMNDFAGRLDATLWKILGSFWEGKLLVERREFARGSALLQKTLDTCDQTGWRICNAEFLGALAQGLAGLGQLDTALVTVDRALARAEHSGERYSIPELLRIKGEVLLQQAANVPGASQMCHSSGASKARAMPTGEPALRREATGARTRALRGRTAEDSLLGAIAAAREQGALFWELRAALSLARFWTNQNRQGEVNQILAPVYDQFTEGFEAADLKQAKSLLEQLALAV
jgi:predicted ATPase